MGGHPLRKPKSKPRKKPKPRPRKMQHLPFLLALFLPLCAGCLMPGDLRELKVSQDSYKVEMQNSLERYREGAISKEDLRDEVARSERRYDERLESQVAKITQRTEEALAAGKEGMSMLEGTGITGTALIALNLYRSFTRKKNLESLLAEADKQKEMDDLRKSVRSETG